MATRGYVEKAHGELDAILSDGDEVYIVRQGDHFAGRYQAVEVSRDRVEMLGLARGETWPSLARGGAIWGGETTKGSSAQARGDRVLLASERLNAPLTARAERRTPHPGGRGRETRSEKAPVSTETGPLVFQALGSIERSDGEMEAIIADGSHVYIVKQGDVFADRYRAVSVDSDLVLAVRAPANPPEEFFARRTNSANLVASNQTHDVLEFSPASVARVKGPPEGAFRAFPAYLILVWAYLTRPALWGLTCRVI